MFQEKFENFSEKSENFSEKSENFRGQIFPSAWRTARLEDCPTGELPSRRNPSGGLPGWRAWRVAPLEALESCPPGELPAWRGAPLESYPPGGVPPWRVTPLEDRYTGGLSTGALSANLRSSVRDEISAASAIAKASYIVNVRCVCPLA